MTSKTVGIYLWEAWGTVWDRWGVIWAALGEKVETEKQLKFTGFYFIWRTWVGVKVQPCWQIEEKEQP